MALMARYQVLSRPELRLGQGGRSAHAAQHHDRPPGHVDGQPGPQAVPGAAAAAASAVAGLPVAGLPMAGLAR